MRTYQIDSSITDRFGDCSLEAEVGVLVGRWGDHRVYVLQNIPTPSLEAGAQTVTVVQRPSKKLGQKGTGAAAAEVDINIKEDWIAEHARQLEPLLPGGLAVVGVYICCQEGGFSFANAHLCRALAGIRGATKAGGDVADLLLLYISRATKKLGLKELPADALQPPSLRVCEAKPGPVLAQFVSVSARYMVEAEHCVLDSAAQHAVHLEELVAAETAAIKSSAACTVDGRLLLDDTVVADAMPSSDCALALQLLSPPAALTMAGSGEVYGRLRLRGTLHGRASVHKRDTLGAAIAALKADLVASLRARVAALLAEDAEGSADEDNGTNSQLRQSGPEAHHAPFSIALPRRVLLPGKAPIVFSDYPLPGDEAAQVLATAEELLSMKDAVASQLEWPEQAATATVDTKTWQPIASAEKPVNTAGQSGSSLACTAAVLGAGLACIVAIAVGAMYTTSPGME